MSPEERALSDKLEREVRLSKQLHGEFYVVFRGDVGKQPIDGLIVLEGPEGVPIHNTVGALRLARLLGVKVAVAKVDDGEAAFTSKDLQQLMADSAAFSASNGGVYVSSK